MHYQLFLLRLHRYNQSCHSKIKKAEDSSINFVYNLQRVNFTTQSKISFVSTEGNVNTINFLVISPINMKKNVPFTDCSLNYYIYRNKQATCTTSLEWMPIGYSANLAKQSHAMLWHQPSAAFASGTCRSIKCIIDKRGKNHEEGGKRCWVDVRKSVKKHERERSEGSRQVPSAESKHGCV